MWIDTHCHLDAAEFGEDRGAVVQRARAAGVQQIVLPAVAACNFDTVRALAHEHGLGYALGIHPLCVGDAHDGDLHLLQQALQQHRNDPRLVAVGEIGIDGFVPTSGPERQLALARDPVLQERYYTAQLKLARDAGLPVLVHVRRSVDLVLKGLRRIELPGGIAHAFNGSQAQALQLVQRGFKLGFGGAMTFDRALQIRARAVEVPPEALVLETDAPDIPPHWLYRTAEARAAGDGRQARNEPAQLPRIAQTLASLRGLSLDDVQALTTANALAVLPRLQALQVLPA